MGNLQLELQSVGSLLVFVLAFFAAMFCVAAVVGTRCFNGHPKPDAVASVGTECFRSEGAVDRRLTT